VTTKYVKYRPKTIGALTAADLGRSGHVREPSIREGIKATLTYLNVIACVHHDRKPGTREAVTYVSDISGVHVIAPSDSRWEVEL